MNKENMELWINALRSGKYGQCGGVLKSEDGRFCCLGVASSLYIKATGNGSWAEDRCFVGKDGQRYSAFLAREVAEWLGIRHSSGNPFISQCMTATEANDSKRLSFVEIADALEDTYLKDNSQ